MTTRQRSGRKQRASAGGRNSNSEKANTKSRQRSHIQFLGKARAPFNQRIKTDTAFDRGVMALFPESGQRLTKLAQLFPSRSAVAIRDWRRGRRNPPAWAKEALATAIEQRAYKHLEISKAVRAIKDGPGSSRSAGMPHFKFNTKRADTNAGPELSTG